jgi:DNA-binding NarL/FixJ family response regulator
MAEDKSLRLQAKLQGLALSKPFANPPEWPNNHASASSRREEKIVIIARELLIRECLGRCLHHIDSSKNYAVETFATIAEWIDACTMRPPPSLILLGAFANNRDNAELERDLDALSKSGNKVPVVILSNASDVSQITAAFRLGARGYILTSTPLDVALSALRVIEVGGTFAPASSLLGVQGQSKIANTSPEQRTATLTPTQTAVSEAIRKGKANKQIAHELEMRESTVKVHIRNIMKKLDARNRTEVAVKLSRYFDSI